LHLACATKDGIYIVRDLCKKGANITIPDSNLRTPLMTAIMSNNRRAAAVLLEWELIAGIDLLDKTDASGLKAIQYCGLFNDPETEARIKTVELALINAQLTIPQHRTVCFNTGERPTAANNAAVDPLDIFPDQ
jgi:ankyrin repeat protein